jgi:hypothetical protein
MKYFETQTVSRTSHFLWYYEQVRDWRLKGVRIPDPAFRPGLSGSLSSRNQELLLP